MQSLTERREIRHFHLFSGLGGGALGFNKGTGRVGNMTAHYRCIGGVDVDAAAVRDFTKRVGIPGTLLDLFDRSQYEDFHQRKPPADWREATAADIQRSAGNERPNIVFLSAPCKGFSGLLSETRSLSIKYQALNRLTTRGVFLMLEAFADDPPEFVLFENVPRIMTRGRKLLDQIESLLRHYGYAVSETSHDCGELGNLAQSRKRCLLLARHIAKVPPFLYEPPKRALRAVGDILGKMPLPGHTLGGPMHRIPSLHWQTWVRLAFVEAGSDWRSLKKLRVADGKLADYLLMPETRWQGGGRLGVTNWSDSAGAVAGASRPENGTFSVADHRFFQSSKWHDGNQYGVKRWEDTANTIGGQCAPGQGAYAVSDPRHGGPAKFNNCYRIVSWADISPSVTGGGGPSAGGLGVADPRPDNNRQFGNIYRVTPWDETSPTVITRKQPSDGALCVSDPRPQWESRHTNNLSVCDWDKSTPTVIGGGKGVQGGQLSIADPRPGWPSQTHTNVYCVADWEKSARTVTGSDHVSGGMLSVADPRPGMDREKGDNYLTAGHYGVVPWDDHTGAVSSAAGHDNGRWNVADPRLPEKTDKLIAVIRSIDGTWHRPFTTLELAALQSLVEPEEYLELDGLSDQAWRERIGNAVPPAAATAIANVMAEALLLAWSGETFQLSVAPIWVRPIAIALSVDQPFFP